MKTERNSNVAKIPCPECPRNGIQITCGPGTSQIRQIGPADCRVCAGTGVITQEKKRWLDIGGGMRNNRLARNLSGREEARRRGMSPVVLNDMEHGKISPL